MPIKVNELFALRQLMVVKCRDGSIATLPSPGWRGSYAPDNGHGGGRLGQLSRDEAFLIAVNVAKLPSVPRQILKDIPRPRNTASLGD